jgi:2-haloacid dehalogenase
MNAGANEQAARAPIRDVVFDLGGVLIDWSPTYLYRDHLGGDPAEVDAFLRETCSPEWHAGLDAGLDFSAAAEDLASRFPARAQWIRQYGPGWERMFAGAHRSTVECLEELARRGYRLHALSNYPRQKVAFLYRAFPFMQVFHCVVLSGLVGAIKPHAEIFDYLSRLLGGAPCLFVDDRAENVEAARRHGIESLLYTPEQGARVVLERLTGACASRL